MKIKIFWIVLGQNKCSKEEYFSFGDGIQDFSSAHHCCTFSVFHSCKWKPNSAYSVCPSCSCCATASCSSPSCCTAPTSRAPSAQSRDATASAATPQEPFPLWTRWEPTITDPHAVCDHDSFISRMSMTKEELKYKPQIKITLPHNPSEIWLFWKSFIAASAFRSDETLFLCRGHSSFSAQWA